MLLRFGSLFSGVAAFRKHNFEPVTQAVTVLLPPSILGLCTFSNDLSSQQYFSCWEVAQESADVLIPGPVQIAFCLPWNDQLLSSELLLIQRVLQKNSLSALWMQKSTEQSETFCLPYLQSGGRKYKPPLLNLCKKLKLTSQIEVCTGSKVV